MQPQPHRFYAPKVSSAQPAIYAFVKELSTLQLFGSIAATDSAVCIPRFKAGGLSGGQFLKPLA